MWPISIPTKNVTNFADRDRYNIDQQVKTRYFVLEAVAIDATSAVVPNPCRPLWSTRIVRFDVFDDKRK